MAAKKGGMRTVGEVLLWWLARVEGNRATSDSYKRSTRSMVKKNIMPALGRVSIAKLDRRLLDDKLVWPMAQDGKKAGTQQKAFQALRQAFLLAEETGRINSNPMAALTFKSFHRGAIGSKPASLSRIDLPGLVQQLSENFNSDPVNGLLPLLMLAHGTRIGETLQAQWSHISLVERVWVLPELNCKSRRQHILPLTPQVLALLARYRQALPDARAQIDWVFPVRGGARLSPTSASAMFRSVSGGKWSSHDLRKLMRDCLADLGVDFFIGERLINHSLGKVSETYLTRDVMERCREALERWHSRLDECGFSLAHGLDMAVAASSQITETPEPAGTAANS
ncbi:tyrosine-type recombinase/integrase [Pseudomonas xionganensis]|uniref:Tyrosine-type recombinase/integrase n=1 Tax=Pseudomonas xionganensis TaxID=2654845 RepID=A0A6I4KXZ3_9PSED|nr:site-specific integrase [Pseudomonas xionganensis]MVW75376.1 tyrosine-type recombinase/integrase [Pseudomonas xionganensis]